MWINELLFYQKILIVTMFSQHASFVLSENKCDKNGLATDPIKRPGPQFVSITVWQILQGLGHSFCLNTDIS